MTTSENTTAKAPEYEMLKVQGRTLRVARWKGVAPQGGSLERPLLFYTGIGANIELMSPLANWFPDRDIITFDMPGIGQSPAPVMPYRPWMISLLTCDLLDRYGYKKVDVMGVSWGGGMAQQFAFQHPNRTGKLILAATSAGTLMVPGDIRALSKMADARRYIDPEFMRKNFQTLYGGENEGADGHVAAVTPPSPVGYVYQLGAMIGWTSAFFLPLLKAKTLVMMGDDDKIVPVINGKILSSLIPNARLEIIPGGGHLFLVSQAKSVVPMMKAFLSEPDSPKMKRGSNLFFNAFAA